MTVNNIPLLKIVFQPSKNKLNEIDINEDSDLSDCIKYEKEEETDHSEFKLKIYNEQNNNKIALIEGRILHAADITNNGDNVVSIADRYDQEIYEATEELVNSKIYKDNDFPGDLLYIARFYVFPEYRKNGIGTFLINNLIKMVEYFDSVEIQFAWAFISPHSYTSENKWVELKDNKEMTKVMEKLFKKAGYSKIGKRKYYALNNWP